MGILTRILAASEDRASLKWPPPWLIDAVRGGADTASGITITPEKSLQSTAVLAAVRVLSESVASLPCIVYRRLERGKERATEHPLYSLLHDQPNPRQTAFEFYELGMVHLALWGNFYAEVERDGAGRVVALWPLRPDRMDILLDQEGRLTYRYTPGGGEAVYLPTELVFHVRGMGSDGLRGYSLISLARQAVGLSMAAEEFGARFFANDARPGVVLQHPGVLGDEAHRRLRESWEARHRGLSASHRVAVLEEGMTIKEIGIPPEDAQFLETRKFQVNEIARIFRIPPHMLGDLERATFSNIEHQSIEFVVHTLRPWLRRWEQAMLRQLFTPRERAVYFAEFLVDGLLRGDIRSRYDAYATARQWGWLSANDIRELENMNPVPGGDNYLMPLNMMALSGSAAARSKAVEGASRTLSLPEVEMRQAALRRRRQLMKSFRRVIEDTARRVVNREVNDVRNAARRILGGRSVPGFDHWLDGFYQEHGDFIERYMRPVFTSYAELVAGAAAEEAGASPGDVPRARLDQFVRDYVESYRRRHVGSSVGQIKSVVGQAVERGEDPLAALEERLNEWQERRPGKIADAEATQGSNAFAKAAFLALGVQTLRWYAFGENCPYCSSLNGKVVGIQGWFLTSGNPLEVGEGIPAFVSKVNVSHPPLHQGCDCMIGVG